MYCVLIYVGTALTISWGTFNLQEIRKNLKHNILLLKFQLLVNIPGYWTETDSLAIGNIAPTIFMLLQ